MIAIRQRKAFTILESLFATSIMILIAIVFFTSIITSFNHIRRALELRTATLILQEEISLVRELSFSDVQSLGTTFNLVSMSALKNATGAITKSDYSGDGKVLKITFRLDWAAFNGNPAARSIVTLITDHGIDKK